VAWGNSGREFPRLVFRHQPNGDRSRSCSGGETRVVWGWARFSRGGGLREGASGGRLGTGLRLGATTDVRAPCGVRWIFSWGEYFGQFFQSDPAQPAKLQGLPLALGGLAAAPQPEQHRGDERAVDWDRQARRGFGPPGAAARDA